MTRLTRAGFRISTAVAGVALTTLACQEPGTGPDVSDTEIWRLELEQTDDGTEGGDIGRRRGTINLVLRLNHTTQADPSCAAASQPNATTFVATVEAPASRLQGPTDGSANGSWNCHGFSAEVRLDDGTVFELTSESLTFDPGRSIDLQTPMLANRWSAGGRRGHFLLAPDERFEYEPFDTHLDVHATNQYDEEVDLSFSLLDSARAWSHHDLTYSFDRFPTLDRAIPVPAGETRIASFPAQPHPDAPGAEPAPYQYSIWIRFRNLPFGSDSYAFHCVMGAERQSQASIIVHEPGNLECATGWLGSIAIFPDPRYLFVRPGETRTLNFTSFDVARVEAEIREPTIMPRVTSFTLDGTQGMGAIEVRVGPDTPRRPHSLIIRGEAILFEPDEVLEPVPLEVYDLATLIEPDTVRIAAGSQALVAVRLDRDGLLGLDVTLEIDQLPPAGFLVPPTFSPAVTEGDSSALLLRIDAEASPGAHEVTVCARIRVDPSRRCHTDSFVLVVTPALPGFDLEVRKSVDRDTVAVGDTVVFTLTATNHGPSIAHSVAVRDLLPDGLTYLSDNGAGAYSPETGFWSLGSLLTGNERTLRIRAIATATATNRATIIAESIGERDVGNNVAEVEVVVDE